MIKMLRLWDEPCEICGQSAIYQTISESDGNTTFLCKQHADERTLFLCKQHADEQSNATPKTPTPTPTLVGALHELTVEVRSLITEIRTLKESLNDA